MSTIFCPTVQHTYNNMFAQFFTFTQDFTPTATIELFENLLKLPGENPRNGPHDYECGMWLHHILYHVAFLPTSYNKHHIKQ